MRIYRHFGPRFEQGEWNGPHFFQGYQHPGHGHHGHGRPEHEHHGEHRHGGHWQQPTPEQQVLRSTASEVARLFAIAARTSHGNTEKQAQLRGFLERSRKELLDLISANTQSNSASSTEDNSPEVAQA